MRRMLFVLGLLCISTIVSAQRTYYYKCTKCLDKDGVATAGGAGIYFTILNQVVYPSDENGIFDNMALKKSPYLIFPWYNLGLTWDGKFYYRKKVKNNHWLCAKKTGSQYVPYMGYHKVQEWDEGLYCLLSEDWSTINIVYGSKTYVFVLSTPTKPEDKIPELIH